MSKYEKVDKYNCKNIVIVFVGSLLNCPNFHKRKIESFQQKFKDNVLIIDYLRNKEAMNIKLFS